MKLTICLVTKGREKYINQVLKSFEPLLLDPDVRVLLIDNGAELSINQTLTAWQMKNSPSVDLVRFDVNDSRPSSYWPVILKTKVDWIVMPGDDDQFRPEILAAWKAAVDEDPDLVAFAPSAAVIDEHDSLTGELLFPTAGMSGTKIEQVAAALHEPPFVWSNLFFRVSKITSQIPASRYVFDWWIGLNLVIAGNIKTSHFIGLDYRVHSEQEGNLAPHRRKFFEGTLWLGNFIQSEAFVTWATNLSDDERILLWRQIVKKKPIYGDLYFARPLIFSIARLLMGTAKQSAIASEIASELAFLNGVFLRDGESKNLIAGRDSILGENPGNIRVNSAIGTCAEIVKASELLNGRENAELFELACRHSKSKIGSVIVDCDSLSPGKPAINADFIVNAITKFCEERNDFEMALSSGERTSLLMLRSLKKRLPGKVRLYLRRMRNLHLSRS